MDAVRGFAILGLIFVNIPLFASADYFYDWWGTPGDLSPVDQGIRFLLDVFITGKCFALLCFLFGAGIALQWERAARTGARFYSVMLRRMCALLLIGAAHAVLLWSGDVLTLYAVMGGVLLLFARLRPIVLRSVALLLIAGNLAFDVWFAAEWELIGEQAVAADQAWLDAIVSSANAFYRDGTFLQVIEFRVFEFLLMAGTSLYFAGILLGICLLGYDSIRSKWYPSGQVKHAWGIGVAGLLLAASTAYLAMAATFAGEYYLPRILFGHCSELLLGWLYLQILMSLRSDAAFVQMLARIGRQPLTNYLLQSLLAGMVFYGYGLGLHGKLTLGWQMVVAGCIVAFQIALSRMLKHLSPYGPIESAAHFLTYGKWRETSGENKPSAGGNR